MTKKLTGREAVISVLDGKEIYRLHENGESWFVTLKHKICSFPSIQQILQHDDWEIVPEPKVWEGVEDAEYTDAYGAVIQIPHEWRNKRVKVRIEEILE